MTRGAPKADVSFAVEPVVDVNHVANSVFHMAELPPDANVQFMTVLAMNTPFVGCG